MFGFGKKNTTGLTAQQMSAYVREAKANLHMAGFNNPSNEQIATEAARLTRIATGFKANGKKNKLSQSGR